MLLICTNYLTNESVAKWSRNAPHIHFQTSGDLFPCVEPTDHHAARIKVFGHERVRKIHKATQISDTDLDYA